MRDHLYMWWASPLKDQPCLPITSHVIEATWEHPAASQLARWPQISDRAQHDQQNWPRPQEQQNNHRIVSQKYGYCFKSLYLGVICYTAKTNWNVCLVNIAKTMAYLYQIPFHASFFRIHRESKFPTYPCC